MVYKFLTVLFKLITRKLLLEIFRIFVEFLISLFGLEVDLKECFSFLYPKTNNADSDSSDTQGKNEESTNSDRDQTQSSEERTAETSRLPDSERGERESSNPEDNSEDKTNLSRESVEESASSQKDESGSSNPEGLEQNASDDSVFNLEVNTQDQGEPDPVLSRPIEELVQSEYEHRLDLNGNSV